MDAVPCGVPHHRIWLHGGREVPQCTDAIRRNTLRCLHSSNAVLRLASAEAARRGLLTPVQAKQLELLLIHDVYDTAWDADMFAVRLGTIVNANMTHQPYNIAHVQWISGMPRTEQPVETLDGTRAMELALAAQERATQWRADVRLLLLALLDGKAVAPETIDMLLQTKLAVS